MNVRKTISGIMKKILRDIILKLSNISKRGMRKTQKIFLNTTGMVLAIDYLNDPETALQFHQQIDVDSLDLNACVYCQTRVSMALQAYLDLADTTNARKMVERLLPYTKDVAHFARMIDYYTLIGDTASINSIIERAPKLNSDAFIQQFCGRMAAQYSFLNNNPNKVDFMPGK